MSAEHHEYRGYRRTPGQRGAWALCHCGWEVHARSIDAGKELLAEHIRHPGLRPDDITRMTPEQVAEVRAQRR